MTDTQTIVARRAPRDWRDAYALRLVATDFLVLVWVVFGVQIAWLGTDSEAIGVSGSRGNIVISYFAISVVIITSWMIALSFYDSRADRVIGVGTTEYRLIVNASTRLFGLVAIVAFLFKVDLARGYILMAFPLGILVLLLSRWMWRQWLGAQRATGDYSSQVILVGSEASVAQIGAQLDAQPSAGYRVVGACVAGAGNSRSVAGSAIPILGNIESVATVLAASHADTVIITSSDDLPPDRVRALNWSLVPGKQHLVVAPGLTGVGGPRIHTRPVAGLPLIHVETPRYDGRKMVAKRAFDIAGASFLLLALSPFLLAIAALVRLSSDGPALFRQVRVGIAGRSFAMLKFRSMVVDAESQLQAMAGDGIGGNGVLFKMRNDPRVTGVGRWLRRFSLDELPQLINVLNGSMSLVGPRPPLEAEVAKYEAHVHRRFLVKPGITGLWQVSGRSNLSWEDSVRLDLFYVENWSMTGDLIILWRTLRAVVGRYGAY